MEPLPMYLHILLSIIAQSIPRAYPCAEKKRPMENFSQFAAGKRAAGPLGKIAFGLLFEAIRAVLIAACARFLSPVFFGSLY